MVDRVVLVTNGARAMLVLMDGVGDAGQHAVDPPATGIGAGYVLDNGQVDEYPNRDTIELALAQAVIRDVVSGSEVAHVTWQDDR